jgi:hypothetical protein
MQSADATLKAIRRLLLAALIAGMAGTASELLLIEHFEDSWQLVPLVLLTVGTVVAIVHGVRPSALTVRLLQVLMGLFLVSGVIGMVLHYRGNLEFALEMQPVPAGVDLVREALIGDPPPLAPGTMILLGVIGLASTYRDGAA